MRIFIFIFFISTNLYASFDMNESMRKTYTHIINLELNDAKKILNNERRENPNNGIIILNQNYLDFVNVIVSDDFTYYKKLLKEKSRIIKSLKEIDNTSPYYLFIQSEIHLQFAFMQLKFNNYTLAIFDFIQAYKLLQENKKNHPEFILNNKGLGLINILLGVIPEKYNWILKLTRFEGDVEKGMQQLDSLINNPQTYIYRTELLFLISTLNLTILDNIDLCRKYLKEIGGDYETNYLLNFIAARIYYKLGENDNCINVLENRPNTKGKISFPYLDYLLAKSKLYKLEYGNAKTHFKYYLKESKSINFIKSTYQNLAYISYLQEDDQQTKFYLNQVLLLGSLNTEEDKKANRDAERQIFSHPVLLEARLLYDGGYYKKALDRIEKSKPSNFSNTHDTVEYWYRKARILQALKESENLIKLCFQKSYNFGKDFKTSYFAPMSALQLALLYEENGDLKNATLYYQKCLKIKDFDYQRDIHYKANLGLKRVSY